MSKIVIVDDDKISATVLSKRLQKRGFETVELHSAAECLEFFKSNEADLLLLDIMMPDMSGMEVLAEIRKTHSQSELPIIMVTAKTGEEDIIDALKAGANDYLMKPIRFEVGVARITTQLDLLALHSEHLKKRELETLNALIVTYNHEINNPLTIGMAMTQRVMESGDVEYLPKVQKSLERIAEIVQKIEKVASSGEFNRESYTEDQEMIKL